MKSRDEFIELCKEKYSGKDLDSVKRAVDFAEEKLDGEKEFCGKKLKDFNLEIGEILVLSGLPLEVVVAGILYGVEKVESFERIVGGFGNEVAGIVFGQLQFRKIREKHGEVGADLLRKILLTGLDDVRIIFVKLAVKLANLRILSGLGKKEQVRIAQDVLDIYVPLALRLGLDYIKKGLENLSFKTIYPKQHTEISNFFKESRSERESFLKGFILEIRKALGSRVGLLDVKGRDKSIGSIFEKIVVRGVALKEQKDHFAIRIIVRSEKDCYDSLGVLHEKYLPAVDRLKDYIASPKPNGYRSIHTVLKTENRKEIEVQIRTREMDEEAEEGRASHWSYKGTRGDSSFEKKVGWLRAVLESQKGSSKKEFMDNLKLDLFADKIYCYTPKGDVRELARNSTLLDFAYSIHQEVGERAVGGRIDGRFVSLREVLKNGVVVEILTNKNQRPRRDWLKFVVSARAKAKIRKGIKRYESLPVPKKSSIVVKDTRDFDSLVESLEFPNAEFSFAKCCYPLPRDDLVGVMKSHRKVLVHRENCSKISGSLKNAVAVDWKIEFNRPINLRVLCSDRSGILADLLNTISRGGFVVRNANARIVGNGEVECSFVVIPKVVDEVVRMVGRVRKVRSVMRVWFE